MQTTKNIIVRLLRNLGSRKEVEQYLKQYSSVDSPTFALIKVGGGILARELDALASSLTFLQNVGLTPIVIHGAGQQIAEALAEAGIPEERDAGQQIVTPRVLEIARKVFQRENLRLVEALEELGTRARPITAGVFEAEIVDRDRLGFAGEVRAIHRDAIESSLRAGHLPIVACLGETPGGQIVTLATNSATRDLALDLQPFKIIFLTSQGGLLGPDGRVISAVNLEEDFAALAADPNREEERQRMQEAKRILDALPHSSSVSITSPDQLAKELFTHTGSGTLVRRGEKVILHESLDQVDTVRLRDLLEACFHRRLDEDYFAKKQFFRIYLAESYRATAILTRSSGVPYLDKFAVTTQAQGAGIGGSLWARMHADNPKLFWRARRENEINPWYFQKSEGSHSEGRWTVFWYGLEGWDEIKACVDHALSLPATLREHGTAEV